MLIFTLTLLTLMKRKVIQLSASTLVISLPIEWTEKNLIKKGSELEVTEKEDSLLLSKEEHSKKIILDTKGRVFDKRYIGDLYIKGFDEIRINYDNKSILDEIKKINILGFEITTEEENYCIIKIVSEVLENEFDTMLRKSFLLTKEIGNGLIEYLNGKDIDLKELRKLEKENNRTSGFCLRILNKKGYKQKNKTTFLYVISRELESLCDIFKYAIDDMQEETEKIKEYFKECIQLFNTFYDIYYKYNPQTFKIFYQKTKELFEKGRKLINEKGTLAHHGLNLVISIRNIYGPYLTMNFEEEYFK